MTEPIDVSMCVTCLVWLANGDGDPDWSEVEEREFVDRLASRWDGWHVVPGDGEAAEFSWSSCDVCGSTLGGDRVPGVAWRLADA